MENNTTTSTWLDIINQNPEWKKKYRPSFNEGFEKLNEMHIALVGNKKKLTEAEALDVLFEIECEQGKCTLPEQGNVLHVQGNGLYYAQKQPTVEFINGTMGVSGYYAGLTIEDLPRYNDFVFKNSSVLRPLLCIVLENYSVHNADSTPGLFVDDTLTIPITGQELNINIYNDDTSVV